MIVTWIIAKKRGYRPLRTEFAAPELAGRSATRLALSSGFIVVGIRAASSSPSRGSPCSRFWSACSRTAA
jgi:hypothetical protein